MSRKWRRTKMAVRYILDNGDDTRVLICFNSDELAWAYSDAMTKAEYAVLGCDWSKDSGWTEHENNEAWIVTSADEFAHCKTGDDFVAFEDEFGEVETTAED
jgi:hypothetical protein